MSPFRWLPVAIILASLSVSPGFAADNSLFARTNLVAWCIVPFDAKKRGPEERAEMLQRLGLTKLAYDWRAEHVPTFEAEILALKKRNIEFFAFWDAQEDAFKLFEKYNLHPQIWKTAPSPNAATQEAKVEAAAKQLLPLVERTRQLGSKLGLYNHGGWGGEPANLLAVCEWLHQHADAKHVGIVYNFHHAHDQIMKWPGAFRLMRPHLLCVNLNGMIPDGDQQGRKILHLGEGTHELRMMRVLRDNGWQGPIGIIDHRMETDSEMTLRANLRGLDWLLKEMDKAGAGGPPPFAPVKLGRADLPVGQDAQLSRKLPSPAVPAPSPLVGRGERDKGADVTKNSSPSPLAERGERDGVRGAASSLPPTSQWLTTGKFGSALDARLRAAGKAAGEEFTKPPFTVECWARLADAGRFNVVVSADPKSSGDHWEIYSFSGKGDFSAYLPGYEPDTIRSGHVITDGQWHYLAMTFDGANVKLYVDARQVAASPVTRKGGSKRDPGPLAIGTAYTGGSEVGCNGLVDEVRFNKGLREIKEVPAAPFASDANTLGLWRFDELKEEQFADASGKGGALKALAQVNSGGAGQSSRSSGRESAPTDQSRLTSAATGNNDPNREVRGTGAADDPSRQTEPDWVDGRWAQTDIGQFLCATVDTPGQRTFKGIAIKVGDNDEGTVCFDTDLMRMSAAWTGGFVKLDARRYGLIAAPKPEGEIQFQGPRGPGWAKDGKFDDPRAKKHGPLPKDWAHFKGMYVNGKRVVLKYTVGGVEVLESPWAFKEGNRTVFVRTFDVGPSSKEMQIELCALSGFASSGFGSTGRSSPHVPQMNESWSTAHYTHEKTSLHVVHTSNSASVLLGGMTQSPPKLIIPPLQKATRTVVAIYTDGQVDKTDVETLRPALLAELKSPSFAKPGSPHWTPLVTKGSVGTGKGPLVIDTLTVPYDNPWKALFFTSGLDFFANGDIAVCTAHGDVWRVSGVDAKLDKLTWRRFATGLFQPLGLKIVGDVAHVLGRDQITRLHDLNSDGEADFYENFNNDVEAAGGGHSYATSLETDPQGNFWFMKCAEDTRHGGTIMRVAADGSKLEVIATGFRNPNGMGVSPDGLVTAADQQGNWVPETRIDAVKQGGFYGFMPMHKRELAPTDFDRPLVFVPRVLDNSAGGQAWIPQGAWGPLGGQMIHLSFGRCTMMAVLRDEVNDGAQGGVVALPGKFLSGVMRGRFNPRDQALYVTGLKGWQTAAIRDGCLQRVRHTGEPLRIPSAFAIHENGIRLTFSVPLDAELARDVESYGLEQWNFRWSEKYGSPDFKPSQPGVEGRDPVRVKSARLLPDGKSVFLETEPLSPVMQFAVQYNLEDKDGEAVRGAFYTTINRVGKVAR
jgi:hypothetical protein